METALPRKKRRPFKIVLSDWKLSIRSFFRNLTFGWVCVYLLMFLVIIFTMLPLVYMLVTSLKPYDEMFYFPPRFFVERPTLSNFSALFASFSASVIPFTRYIFNSAVVTVFSVAGTCLFCSMGAYGLSKFKIPGSAVIFNIIIATLMFSIHVTRIPSYLIASQLGFINSYFGVIIMAFGASGNFFLMKQFIDQFPKDFIEAARIDGAGEFRIYWSIVMPSQKPALATLLVMSFVSSWNDAFTPLIFFTKESMKTLPLAIQTLYGGPGTAALATQGISFAAAVIMTIPVVVIFTILQRKVLETMTYAGIKG